MFIVMHCGGISFNGQTIKESSLGGSETAAYYMAKELVASGHHVTIFTNSQDTGTFDGVKYEWAGELSNDCPLGNRFTFYAENTPHDVLIIQRHPRAFERKWASKINLWWLHDLALYRTKDLVMGQMWNVDKILCVSEYHKAQVAKVYGIPADSIAVVNNGVDMSLYADDMVDVKVFHPGDALGSYRTVSVRDPAITGPTFPENEYHMFYSSRPERGLVNLVKPDGIMERLSATHPHIHLHVCGYENTTPQMKEHYEYLWARCDALPNVTNHGALTKQELAALQKACDAWIYPTEFEEVSCITAMEAMAAGCVIISNNVAALSETCDGDAHTVLFSILYGASDIVAFAVAAAQQMRTDEQRCRYTWAASAAALLATVSTIFVRAAEPTSLMHHFLRHSDIKAFEAVTLRPNGSAFVDEMLTEYDKAYRFYREDDYANHYASVYQREKDRGVNYGPEDVSGTMRFQHIAGMVASLADGSHVLDYGCAHGHYVVALAEMFPKLMFTGADIAQSNLDIATRWAADEGLTNIKFKKVSAVDDMRSCEEYVAGFDFIIAAEVIEHVGNPQQYVDHLAQLLSQTGRLAITVPYGPWEAQGYREHGYWRTHLHHFERQDLYEMLGHHPEYKIVAAPSGHSQFHTPLGSYIVTFKKPRALSRKINYARKILQTMPDQTVTCCMIVKDAEQDIQRCLRSVLPFVQEVVIGVDRATTDATTFHLDSLERDNPLVAFRIIELQPVTETGFAAARNATLNHATCDWIFWIDSDEVLINGQQMSRLLRNSMYNGFAMKQQHFSADPAGIIKVDLPCRLFRNHKGIQFFGAVHEHPELKLNEGLGPVSMMSGAAIIHYGYADERVRRKRFDRNLPLLKRDREELPSRLLGKFLWLRDLAQLTQYEIEANALNTVALPQRIEDGIKLWLELLESKNYRIVLDALPYYSQLAIMKGGGLDFSFVLNANWMGEAKLDGQPTVEGYFAEKAHAFALMVGLAEDKLPTLDRRYL